MLVTVVGVGVALVVGFLAGYCTFKRSLTWCSHCGQTLKCLNCLRVAQQSEASTRP
jgi:hypothetical protein